MRSFLDHLPLGADDSAAHRLTAAKRGVDHVRLVARAHFIGDDLVRIIPPTARLAAREHPVADHIEQIVGGRSVDEQVPLSGRDDDLERAIVLAGDGRLRTAQTASRSFHREVLNGGFRKRAVRAVFGHLAADNDPAGHLDVDRLPDGTLGPGEFDLGGKGGLALGRNCAHSEIVAGRWVHLEPPLIIGARPRADHPTELALAGRNGDHRARNGLARVRGDCPALDDCRRLDC